jgi:flagellar motor component MotA
MKSKLNINKINIKKLSRIIGKQKSSWHKGILLAASLSVVIFVAASAYLLFRPLNSDLKRIIEEEVKSTNIIFDKKTLEDIKKRHQPQTILESSGSKDPFSQF